MDNENINAVIDNALVDNVSGMKEALYNSINDKIFAAIEQRKIAIASNLFNNTQSTEPSVEPSAETQ